MTINYSANPSISLRSVLKYLHQGDFKEAKADQLTELYKEVTKYHPELKVVKWDPRAEETRSFWTKAMHKIPALNDDSPLYGAMDYQLAKTPEDLFMEKYQKSAIERINKGIRNSTIQKPPRPTGTPLGNPFGSANVHAIIQQNRKLATKKSAPPVPKSPSDSILTEPFNSKDDSLLDTSGPNLNSSGDSIKLNKIWGSDTESLKNEIKKVANSQQADTQSLKDDIKNIASQVNGKR